MKTPSAGGSYVLEAGGELKRVEGTEPAPGPGEAMPPAEGHAVPLSAPLQEPALTGEGFAASAKPAGKRQVKGDSNA